MGRGFRNWVSALAALAVATPALAAPRILAMFPTGGQRGTSVRATLTGEGLDKLSGFFSLGTGLAAKILPGAKPDSCPVEIVIAPDAPPGVQQVRFYDAAGISNPRYFRVGLLKELLEAEPNDEIAKAPTVTLPVTVNGRISQNPDRDGVTFTAQAGQTIVCEIEGLRVLGQVGDSWLKGFLEVVDARGRTLASSEGSNDEYYRWDPLIVFTPKESGQYTAFFRDLNWRGDARSVYRLTIGAVPHAVGLSRLGGQRGTAVPLCAIGPYCATPRDQWQAPDDEAESVLVSPGGALNARPFQLSSLPDLAQTDESRQLPGQSVTVGYVVNGAFRAGGFDHYRFTLAQPTRLAIEVFSRRLGTPADPEIALYDGKGALLQVDDDSRPERDAWIVRDLPAGEYRISLRDIDDRGGETFGYRLVVAPPVPRLRLRALPDAPSLPRGKSVTIDLHLDREHFDEAATIALENPPPGVTAAPVTIEKGKQDGKLTLTVAADAALGPIRLRVVGTVMAGGKPVRAVARTEETYNIQGTAYQRELPGPIALIVAN